MRKKLLIAAVIILILLLSFFAFLQYRQYRSYRIPIHGQAQTIVKIHTDAIIKELISNYGIQFRKKIGKKIIEDSTRAKNTGIYFPANILIYNLRTKQASTLFCTVPLYNKTDFKAYMKKNFKFELTDSADKFYGSSVDGKFHFVGNDDYVSMAYSPKLENVSQELEAILNGQHVLPQNAALLDRIKHQNAAISLVGNGFSASLHISGKEIKLQGELKMINHLIIPAETLLQQNHDHGFAGLSVNALPPASLLKPVYKINEYKLYSDSLRKYFLGFASIQLGPNSTTTDTIISYEYDDNFEMQAIKTTQSVLVPAIQLQLSAEKGLYTYLQSEGFIDTVGNFNKSIFPLYPVTVKMNNDQIMFSTNPKLPEGIPIPSKALLNAQIDFTNMDSTGMYQFIRPYTQGMQRLDLHAQKSDAGAIEIKGSLMLDQSAIKWLMRLGDKF